MSLCRLQSHLIAGLSAIIVSTTEIGDLKPKSFRITVFSAALETLIKGLIISGLTSFQTDTKVVAKAQEIIVGEEAFNWLTDQIYVQWIGETEPKNLE